MGAHRREKGRMRLWRLAGSQAGLFRCLTVRTVAEAELHTHCLLAHMVGNRGFGGAYCRKLGKTKSKQWHAKILRSSNGAFRLRNGSNLLPDWKKGSFPANLAAFSPAQQTSPTL
eukprot:scaffold377_cov269-Pinguiococcus_pyrenoidosus.AAC.11